jgi:poly-gamma-glutamate capsule biosynthesis protein CapA/YwtB (metallophosphatase superfamily)
MRRLRVGAAIALGAAVLLGCHHGGRSAASRTPATGHPGSTVAKAPLTRPPGTFTIMATGDLLMHEPVVRAAQAAAGGQGYNFEPLLAQVRPILSRADLAICHMETPLSADDTRISYYPSFRVPHEIASAASWAGYKTCTTASNHTLDYGFSGVQATLDSLDAAHLLHVGTARSATERSWQIYDVRGVRVAHLDYTYGLNGIPVPKDKPWVVNVIDTKRILADAHEVRLAGAQFVMVALHWGQEYQSAATPQQRALAQALLASPDIDFVYGCHVHVVQPIEQINGKYVVYGLGNFLAKHAPCCDTPQTRDGMILQVTVGPQGDHFVVQKIVYTPTFVDPATMTVLPVPEDLANPSLDPALRQELLDSYQRTVSRVDLLGADTVGVQPDKGH